LVRCDPGGFQTAGVVAFPGAILAAALKEEELGRVAATERGHRDRQVSSAPARRSLAETELGKVVFGTQGRRVSSTLAEALRTEWVPGLRTPPAVTAPTPRGPAVAIPAGTVVAIALARARRHLVPARR
jgi:hypothetical protein